MPNGDAGLPTPPEPGTLSVNVFDIAPPETPTDLPRIHLDHYFRDTYDILNHKWKLPSWIAGLVAALIVAFPATLMLLSHIGIEVLQPFLPALAGAVFEVLEDLRKTLDPQFAKFSVSVLNEFLGTDFTIDHLPQGEDINAHLARAEEIGFLFHRQLLTEFLTNTGVSLNPAGGGFQEPTGPTGAGEKITPVSGIRAAARFSGLAINFGTATGIIATLGGLVPFAHLDEIREIGENVARNLGIGRLQRLALAPIVQILLAEPYKWFINEMARPKQFSLGDVVNPFSGSVMSAQLIWRDLAREGYSDEKIGALLELHRKKTSEADVFTLFEAGHWEEDRVKAYYERLGYTGTDATTKLEADRVKANRPYFEELRAAVVGAYADHHIDRAELRGIIDGLPLRREEKDYILLAADYKRKVPSRHLTVGEIQTAFAEGIFSVTEFREHLASFGYSDDDQSVLLLLTLEKLAKVKEKAQAVAARAHATTTKKAGGSVSPLPPPEPPTP